ncbi:MAG TPA: hypothetical protein VD907_01500 [Verrucomicrobiae bacterium]|nr:hypothetical protein [Verrucomicrobiae bacterium]
MARSGLLLAGALIVNAMVAYAIDHYEKREIGGAIVSFAFTALAVWFTYEAYQHAARGGSIYLAALTFNSLLVLTSVAVLAYVGRRATAQLRHMFH